MKPSQIMSPCDDVLCKQASDWRGALNTVRWLENVSNIFRNSIPEEVVDTMSIERNVVCVLNLCKSFVRFQLQPSEQWTAGKRGAL